MERGRHNRSCQGFARFSGPGRVCLRRECPLPVWLNQSKPQELGVRLGIVVVAILFCASGSLAQEAVRPPCGGAPLPSYAAPGHPPHIRATKVEGWTAPRCAGWTSGRSTLLVAVAGAFEHDGGAEALLAALDAFPLLSGRDTGLSAIIAGARWLPMLPLSTVLTRPEGALTSLPAR